MKLRAGRWVGLLALTWAAAFAQTQVLYVGDLNDGTIKRVDLSGNVSTYATGFDHVYGLAGDASGNLYVSSSTAHKVVAIDPSRNVTDYATNFPINSNLLGMTFDAAGNLYIADVSVGVYKVLPGGSASLWATGMSYPRDVAFNSSGVLYAVGGYNPMSMYSIASNGTATLFASQAASAGFACIDFGYLDTARVGGNNTFYDISTAGVVSTFQAGLDVTDVVYAGNGTFYFLAGGSLYRDVAGNISTLATGFSNPTSLALVTAVPEPATTALGLGLAGLVALAMRRRWTARE